MDLVKSLSRWWSDASEKRLDGYCERQLRAKGSLGRMPPPALEITTDEKGEIRNVRIGKWRFLGANDTRRIVTVRRLEASNRVAIKIELKNPVTHSIACTIWELYDLSGRLLAMLQSTSEEGGWLTTDFQTGRTTRSIAQDCNSRLSA